MEQENNNFDIEQHIIENNNCEETANLMLKSNKNIKIDSKQKLQTFFDLFEPLNLKYDMGMNCWEMTEYKDKNIITFHNNISKYYYNFVYDKYINKIREKLENCETEFYYTELREYRYNKTKEIVFAFKI